MTVRRQSDDGTASPALVLKELAKQAVNVAKKARRHGKSLSGDNFYANKLAELYSDAREAFEEFAAQSTGDATALAELIEIVFSARTAAIDRLTGFRELSAALRTIWRKSSPPVSTESAVGFFPTTILEQTRRAYISSIGRQMNGCYSKGWRDACAVMMRRLLEIGIIEAFEKKAIASKIKDAEGNYFQLTKLVDLALAEPKFTLSRNTKKSLPKLKDAGHLSAHGRYYLTALEDLERAQPDFRVALEEFLHHAGLQ